MMVQERSESVQASTPVPERLICGNYWRARLDKARIDAVVE